MCIMCAEAVLLHVFSGNCEFGQEFQTVIDHFGDDVDENRLRVQLSVFVIFVH